MENGGVQHKSKNFPEEGRKIMPFYSVSFEGSKRLGQYNAYVLCVIAVGLCWYFHVTFVCDTKTLFYPNVMLQSGTVNPVLFSVSKEFVLLLCISLAVGLYMDLEEEWEVKVCVSALPVQLVSYLELVLRIAADVWHQWVVSILLYAVFRRILDLLHIPEVPHGMGHPLFLVYLVLRTVFLGIAFWFPKVSKEVPRSRMVWSYFLGHVGLAVRCYRLNVMEIVAEKIYLGWNLKVLSLEPNWFSCGLFVVVTLAWTYYAIRSQGNDLGNDYLYYKLHRTFHRIPQLWAFCHAVHHRARVPTVLDSGTIGPPELVLTETAIPAQLLWPHSFQLGWDLYHIIVHYVGHDTNQQTSGRHHVLHHLLRNYNFGMYQEFDIYFGTSYIEEEEDVKKQ